MIEDLEVSAVARVLGPGGKLRAPASGLRSAPRAARFAHDVARALDHGGVCRWRPTGVGKSLGYLVPAVLWSRREREAGRRLDAHEAVTEPAHRRRPAARTAAAFDPPPKVVRLKGRHNYLCPRRWRCSSPSTRRGRAATAAERAGWEWADGTATGDLDEFDFGARAERLRAPFAHRVRAAAVQPGRVPGRMPVAPRAASRRQRRVVVVNHALLVTGLPNANVLPPFRALVVDEAHHLDAVFTAQSTVRQSLPPRCAALAHPWRAPGPGRARRRWSGPARDRRAGERGPRRHGSRDRTRDAPAALATLRTPLHGAGRAFYTQVAASLVEQPASAYEPRARFRQLEDVTRDAYEALERLFTLGRDGAERWHGVLSCLARADTTPEMEELVSDVMAAQGAWQEWQAGLRFLTDPKDGEFVYWRGGARAETANSRRRRSVARRVQKGLCPSSRASCSRRRR